jgi:hypothetical protein
LVDAHFGVNHFGDIDVIRTVQTTVNDALAVLQQGRIEGRVEKRPRSDRFD